MNDKRFDRIIRERLREAGSGHQPSGWAYLQRRLDAEEAVGAESDSRAESFDEAIREKLVPASPAALVPDWEAMEERLDQAEGGVPEPADSAIDEVAFQKLRNLSAPFRRDHWLRIVDRLDGEFVNAASVWRSKLVELGLMAMLLFTLWQNFPGPSAPVPVSDRGADLSEMNREEGSSGIAVQPQTAPERVESRAFAGEEGTPVVPQGPAGASLAQGQLPEVLARSASFASFEPLPVLEGSATRPPLSLNDLETTLAEHEIRAHSPVAQASMLARKEQPLTISRNGFGSDYSGVIKSLKQRPFIHFGMFGSLDYNRIISPSKYLLDTRVQEFDRYELGYSGGITLGFDFGPWELQSGAIYSSKQYRPLLAELWEGEFDEGYNKTLLKDIQLNIVQIPLMLRYNLVHYDAWRFYMTAGASVHVALTANYFYDNIGKGDIAEPNGGWFDGGTFRENSYLTGNVGFGLERFVTPTWSLFAQPTYQHALNMFNHGMGPTQDRISTMSLYTGIRVRIER